MAGIEIELEPFLREIIGDAMAKQIPTKPVNIKIGTYVECAECPRCKEPFMDIGGVAEAYGEVWQFNYCPECGQRIDWNFDWNVRAQENGG